MTFSSDRKTRHGTEDVETRRLFSVYFHIYRKASLGIMRQWRGKTMNVRERWIFLIVLGDHLVGCNGKDDAYCWVISLWKPPVGLQRLLQDGHVYVMSTSVCHVYVWTSRCSSWFLKRQRNQRSNCQHQLDHWKSKRVPEKHLFLLYWLCQSLWLGGSQ